MHSALISFLVLLFYLLFTYYHNTSSFVNKEKEKNIINYSRYYMIYTCNIYIFFRLKRW